LSSGHVRGGGNTGGARGEPQERSACKRHDDFLLRAVGTRAAPMQQQMNLKFHILPAVGTNAAH
jgi:hypothetical protein